MLCLEVLLTLCHNWVMAEEKECPSCLRLTENENWDTPVVPDTALRILYLEAAKLFHCQVRAFNNRELCFNSPSKFEPKIAFPFPELSQLW